MDRSTLCLCLALLLALAGCNSETTTPTPIATPTPAALQGTDGSNSAPVAATVDRTGWQGYNLVPIGAKLELPKEWAGIDLSGPDKEVILKISREKYPELAPVLPETAENLDNQRIRFLAFLSEATEEHGGIAPNINLVHHTGSGLDTMQIEALGRFFQQELSKSGAVMIPGAEIVALPGGEAARYEYFYKGKNPEGEEQILQGEQYIWKTNTGIYVLIISGLAEKFETLRPTARGVAESIQLTPTR